VLRNLAFGLACALVVSGATAARQSLPAEPVALARAIQQHYNSVNDFSAAFTHSYQGGVLRKLIVERGTVRFKKPGLMRWVYTSPEHKEFVADGVRLYAYVPEDRQVTVSAMPADGAASTPALFLAGQGDLTRDFTAGPPADAGPLPAGTVAVRLTPKSAQAEFEWMTLIVDRSSSQVRGLITGDGQGGRSTFTFEQVRENTGVAAREFRFTIPRGIDVITNTQPGR
jgi:outer membrane lipoprotein carrier protein